MQKDTEPPTKRRKTLPTMQRATTATSTAVAGAAPRKAPETLDLRNPLSDPAELKVQKIQIDKLLKLLRKKKKIVVIAGAGMSVGAGIPDFRSSNGLFSTLKTDMKLKTSGKQLFDASVYQDDQLTSSFHDMVRNLHTMTAQASPTAFHHLLATLAKEQRLLRLYSQNVDCIDTQLEPLKTAVPLGTKGPWPRTIQLHGGLEKMVCQKCGWLGGFEASLFRGSEPPDCSECMEMDSVRGIAGKRTLGVGKLRPRIVLYNEFNPDAEAIGAVTKADLKSRPDALIVVGTSLKIPGVKRIVREMCNTVRDYRGGMTVWINEDEPPTGKEFEGAFDLIVKGDCEKVAKLANMPRWDGSETPLGADSDSDGCGLSIELDPGDLLNGDSQATIEVHVPQLLSPSTSPHPKEAKITKKRKAQDSQEDSNPPPPAKKPRGRKKSSIIPEQPPPSTIQETICIATDADVSTTSHPLEPKKTPSKLPAKITGVFKTIKKLPASKVQKPKATRRPRKKVPPPPQLPPSPTSPPSPSHPSPPASAPPVVVLVERNEEVGNVDSLAAAAAAAAISSPVMSASKRHPPAITILSLLN